MREKRKMERLKDSVKELWEKHGDVLKPIVTGLTTRLVFTVGRFLVDKFW